MPSISAIPSYSALSRALRSGLARSGGALTASVMLLAALFVAGGCGGSEMSSKRGYVTCGGSTCTPGQYCYNDYTCNLGCQSNDNCASDQVCAGISPQTHIGTCMNNAPDTTNPAVRCQQNCNKLAGCGLINSSEAANCTAGCSAQSSQMATVFHTCIEAWACESATSAPDCQPYECGGSKYLCTAGSCVNHSCQ